MHSTFQLSDFGTSPIHLWRFEHCHRISLGTKQAWTLHKLLVSKLDFHCVRVFGEKMNKIARDTGELFAGARASRCAQQDDDIACTVKDVPLSTLF